MAARIIPGGGQKTDKPWRDALMLAVNERVDGKDSPKKLRKLADVVVGAALGGDMTAAKEIADRLDGKAPQALEHAGAGGGPLVVKILSFAESEEE